MQELMNKWAHSRGIQPDCLLVTNNRFASMLLLDPPADRRLIKRWSRVKQS